MSAGAATPAMRIGSNAMSGSANLCRSTAIRHEGRALKIIDRRLDMLRDIRAAAPRREALRGVIFVIFRRASASARPAPLLVVGVNLVSTSPGPRRLGDNREIRSRA